MKYLNEYRDPLLVDQLLKEIKKKTTRDWVIMEICGGQTHAIMRYGLDQLLPDKIELVHGPGCPVCVTSLQAVEQALSIASLPGVIFTSFGDMLRVPGSQRDLFSVRASGADVRVVYSPLDAVSIAQRNPDHQVVFFAIGFETTAPANAMAILKAINLDVQNFSLLVSQVRVPPAINAILSSPSNRVEGFLAAGHVCTVMGYWEYQPISEKYKIPIVVTGFEPVDILKGILLVVDQLENHNYGVKNAYERLVTRDGNQIAQKTIDQVFVSQDQLWRGIGEIPGSGWGLRPEYAEYNALNRFTLPEIHTQESSLCIAGEILQGVKKPYECTQFGSICTPERPIGATMVSSEGACSAYFRYWNKQ